MELHQVDRPALLLRRREFLAYGAGAALLPSVSWARTGAGDELALGYCTPVDGDRVAAVIPAQRLGTGDSALRRGVRLTVEGLVGDGRRLAHRGIRALDLAVGYELTAAGCGAVDFRAWSWQLLPVLQDGSANAFTVPVEPGLRLALEIETPFGVERRETVLVTGGESGRQKLRSGRYLIAPGGPLPRRLDADESSEPLIAVTVEAA